MMENLLESNERTLMMFSSVCSGLSECIALVHADIKQMIEHRNQLARIEQEKLQSKLVDPTLELALKNGNQQMLQTDLDETEPQAAAAKIEEDDPHHLARLKLLDKRLADSFSQALSMCDQQKSSLVTKKQHYRAASAGGNQRSSILQVILGKGSGSNNNTRKTTLAKQRGKVGQHDQDSASNNTDEIDNRVVIDDINHQTRLAMQYSKQLEAHLFRVEDLRARYEMHLKMGLVVKSVSRAYSSSTSTSSSSHHHSPDSLGRRPHNCTSSLVINDTSSLGTTHSSLSSLNLSSWSFSRRNHHDSQSRQPRQQQQQQQLQDLSKLISPRAEQQQRQTQHEFERSVNPCHCQLDQQLPVICGSDRGQATPSPKPISHYDEFVAPTAVGTLSRIATGDMICINQHSPTSNNVGGGGGLLHKSASHSSLRVSKGRMKKPQVAGKATIKEFIANIERIESEFESYMGSFLLNIEDIRGFARVCQGDVFEINIKYGQAQKFKTKISLLKDGRQKCDNRQTIFKSRIADVIAVKAYECKGLGKRVLLGNKLCETRDLFTARSQMMTISLNQTGSIKLNLIITWNPLHLTPSSSPHDAVHSFPSIVG